MEKKATKLAKDLFGLLGIDAKIKVDYQKSEGEEPALVTINVDSSEHTGLLIGRRGETLSAIQSFLGIALKREQGDWVRVNVNVGDWKERHEDYLQGLADQAAQRARETGEPQNLYNLTPTQRRVIHMALSEQNGVSTESQGEGEERYLVVKVKVK